MNLKTLIVMFCIFAFAGCKQQEVKIQALKKAPTKVVKVAVVIMDPVVDGKRMHETFKTPGYQFQWNDPWVLNKEYEDALEEVSGGVVDYQITEIIDAKDCFVYLRKSGEKLSEERMIKLLQEPDWKTLKEEGTGFDYTAFAQHYGFDKKRDAGEIHEVWVWAFPLGGMWESNMQGDGAFWINSEPTENPNCKAKLAIMGLNYERDLACALESYGHRFESVMMKVYGWWDYDKKNTVDELTTWERFSAYASRYNKYNPGQSQVGNVHFPPNGAKDYDWGNKTQVNTFADNWAYYPNVKDENPRIVDCSEWNCSHIGYMKWWFKHLPNFEGVNPKDGTLNNWWHYVVDYDEAISIVK